MGNKKSTEGAMQPVRLVRHGPGAKAFRLGLGPGLRPMAPLKQLQELLNTNAFWAQGRSLEDLGKMMRNSAVCVTAWQGTRLVGFGRATSDGVYRGAIWDLVVDAQHAGRGVGRAILTSLLQSEALVACERIYLMTTNSAGFYQKMGFQINRAQSLMVREKSG